MLPSTNNVTYSWKKSKSYLFTTCGSTHLQKQIRTRAILLCLLTPTTPSRLLVTCTGQRFSGARVAAFYPPSYPYVAAHPLFRL